MTIEELKALAQIDWNPPKPYDHDRYYHPLECQYLDASSALWEARHELLAVVEAAEEDFKDRDGWMTERSLSALRAFNAKLASL